jgi:hypothetical protein
MFTDRFNRHFHDFLKNGKKIDLGQFRFWCFSIVPGRAQKKIDVKKCTRGNTYKGVVLPESSFKAIGKQSRLPNPTAHHKINNIGIHIPITSPCHPTCDYTLQGCVKFYHTRSKCWIRVSNLTRCTDAQGPCSYGAKQQFPNQTNQLLANNLFDMYWGCCTDLVSQEIW